MILNNQNISIPSGAKICLNKNTSLIIKNSNLIIGDDKNKNVYIGSCLASKEKLDGLVIENSQVKISNLVSDGLSSPSLKLRKLYGSINFIQSNINIESMKILNSQTEDSVNFIN